MIRRLQSLFLYSDEKAVYTACILALMCFFGYVYFVSVSVVEVVMREELIGRVGEVATNISVRESEFIALKSVVTEEEATRLGLRSLSGKSYVTIPVSALSLNQ